MPKHPQLRGALVAIAVSALLPACDPVADPVADAAPAADAALPDAALPDAALPDAAPPACLEAFAGVDLLIVIDDSGSMCEEQERLGQALATTRIDLEARGYDYRVAVVTTDMNPANPNRGRFGTPATPPVASVNCLDPAGNPDVPDTADCVGPFDPVLDPAGLDADAIDQRLRCMVTVGTQGDGFEMGLAAARLALDCDGPNADQLATCCADPDDCDRPFLRPDAALAVLIVSDEDDCSDPANTLDAECTMPGACEIPRTGNSNCVWERARLVPPEEIADAIRVINPRAPAVAAAAFVGPTFAPIDGHPVTFDAGQNPPACEAPDGSRIIDAMCCPDGICLGDVAPVCTSQNGDAYAADRYRTFTAALDLAPCLDPAGCDSICDRDPGPTIDRLLDTLAARLPPLCE